MHDPATAGFLFWRSVTRRHGNLITIWSVTRARVRDNRCRCTHCRSTAHSYRRRKVIPEPVFGWMKHVLGFKRFNLRGLHKVAAEWNLVCLAVNLKRMPVLMSSA